MKQIITTLILIISLNAYSQTYVGDKIQARSTLKVGNYEVNAISDDTTLFYMRKAVIPTEHAAKQFAKNYADSVSNPEVYSVKRAGADNTGILNTYSYIKQGIDANKKIVYMSAGYYKLSQTVFPKDSITFIGDARGGTVIVIDGDFPAFKMSPSTGGRGCQFRDISFIGTKSSGATTLQQAILIDSTDQVYVNNVSCYNFGGWAIEVKNNGFCCATYVLNATRGNIVTDVYVTGSYGGVSFSNRAEYNVLTNSTFVENYYGIQNIGGNNRINSNSSSNNQIGIYETSGSNHGHGPREGNTFNHNNVYNVYLNGVVNPVTYTGNHIMAGGGSGGRIYLKNCSGISFAGGLYVRGTIPDTIIVENCSNIKFDLPNEWIGNVEWLITGESPSVLYNGKIPGTLSLYDPKYNKRFDISHSNGNVNLIADFIGVNQPSPAYKFDVNGTGRFTGDLHVTRPVVSDSSDLSAPTGFVKEVVSAYVKGSIVANRLGYGSGTSLGSDTAFTVSVGNQRINITGYQTGQSPGLFVRNWANGNGSGATVNLANNLNNSLQIFMGGTGNVFIPNMGAIYSSTADGFNMAMTKPGSFFNVANNLNATLGTIARFFYSGNVAIGSITDDGNRLSVVGNIKGTDTISGNLITGRNIIWKTITAGDGDVTAVPGAAYVLPDITASRNFTIPSFVDGSLIEIHVENTSGFSWQAAGATLYDPAGNPITSFSGSQVYVIRAVGGKWRLVSMF